MAQALAYFDTSVLVKRYVAEPGGARARVLLRRHRCVSSVIAPLEAISALARRRAGGEMTGRDFSAVTDRLRKDRESWELVGVGERVVEEAEEIIRSTGVRTLDAVHLGSARSVQVLSGQPIPFITADARQRSAAVLVGLEVVWVE